MRSECASKLSLSPILLLPMAGISDTQPFSFYRVTPSGLPTIGLELFPFLLPSIHCGRKPLLNVFWIILIADSSALTCGSINGFPLILRTPGTGSGLTLSQDFTTEPLLGGKPEFLTVVAEQEADLSFLISPSSMTFQRPLCI